MCIPYTEHLSSIISTSYLCILAHLKKKDEEKEKKPKEGIQQDLNNSRLQQFCIPRLHLKDTFAILTSSFTVQDKYHPGPGLGPILRNSFQCPLIKSALVVTEVSADFSIHLFGVVTEVSLSL